MSSSKSGREWPWVVFVSGLIMLATSIPIIVGTLNPSPGMVFSGTVYDRQDFAVHLATMRWAKQSNWAYSLVFTTESAPSRSVKLAYVALGKLDAWLNGNPVLTYHLARVVFGWLALLLLYALMRRIFTSRWNRRFAFLVAALASGLGWLQLALGIQLDPGVSPIDFWLSDAYVFFSLMLFPHFAVVAICILGAILGYDRYLGLGDSFGLIITQMAIFIILAIQPFSIALAYLSIGGMIVGRWRQAGKITFGMVMPLVILVLTMLPFVWFNVEAFNQDEVWRSFASQNITLSPPPLYYLMGIGLLTPLALYGGWIAWRDRDRLGIMAGVWLLGAGVLVYLPTQFQRRFSLFVMIPLSILAVLGLKQITDRLGPFRRSVRFVQLIFLVLISISSIYLVAGGVLLALNQHADIYDPADLVEALDWLAAQPPDGQCALSSPRTGLLVPTLTNLRSYVAHPIETAYYETKLAKETDFYSGQMSSQESERFLSQVGCEWIIVGPYEETEPDRLQAQVPDLEIAYANTGVTIFRWVPEEGESP
jgi:hypothetical protein